MQRRQFIVQSGLTAAAVLPSTAVLAKSLAVTETSSTDWTLLSVADSGACQASSPCHRGTVRITVNPELVQAGVTAQAKLWFQTEAGPAAFELASFARTGASQRLRLLADSEKLLSLECMSGDCTQATQLGTTAAGQGHLGLGQHWLVLHTRGETPANPESPGVLARIHLQVSAV